VLRFICKVLTLYLSKVCYNRIKRYNFYKFCVCVICAIEEMVKYFIEESDVRKLRTQ